MGIEGGVLVTWADSEPVLQVLSLMKVNGMEHEHRQGKVINRVTVSPKLELDRVVLMNFRQYV